VAKAKVCFVLLCRWLKRNGNEKKHSKFVAVSFKFTHKIARATNSLIHQSFPRNENPFILATYQPFSMGRKKARLQRAIGTSRW
jgi:hypothetical protein